MCIHFTVAVITNSMEGFYDALAPFKKIIWGLAQRYMEFYNVEEEYLKEYEEGEDEEELLRQMAGVSVG